ncbi:ATP-dependent RNA helicase MTR4 [Plasmodium brasilianum]|uniref:ATP-dependent RNA helicase MTR4 n=1 Tax=Plasmodium brasilianum TaxID=5824 RepID=A0ACB9Y6U7_PLABR|nr:ATP-dependent RNA helicase MTR4 [Plasmodium brasilianum]
MSKIIDDLFNVFEENDIEENILIKNEEDRIGNNILSVEKNDKEESNNIKNKEEYTETKQSDKIIKEMNANKKNRKEEYHNNNEDKLSNTPQVNYKINIENLINKKRKEDKLIKNQVREEIYNDIQNFDGTTNNVNKKVRKISEEDKNRKKKEKNNTNNSKVEEILIENSKTINNDDVLVLEEFGSDINCIHKCVRPKSYVHNELSESIIPARTYKFELDTFQKKSIECLERNESVLVSAHTSAGKTVIAEYAIALGLRDKQRVIYTSPIKALSNQKYRDLSEEFKDVGLITGDISINPEASIIVMTTEILRSMLYRGSSLTKEVKWVIFDEIHYMRDRDRGVIWEETIILLPLMVRLIFLSATIPNGIQFAEWVSSIKSQACHIVYTDYRPTPLQHYIFPTSSESVFLICDENKEFKRDNFIKAVNAIKEKMNMSEDNLQRNNNINKYAKKMRKNTYDIEKIVQMCHSRNYTPLIIFAFSKKECEVNATSMHKVDLTDETEKEVIKELYENAIQILADDDRALPQVQFILPLLLRGIGIHHGGLLPIIKEIIEIMFQESLLKVLFSTETFSMGINMPAKTVVFTSLKKFDGLEKRLITSGEYIQMAGRAGRRGLDDRGIVIIMLDSPLHWKEAEKLFVGEANRLVSQFHLGYNMILNLLRIEGITPEFMIERSFIQYQMKKNLFQKILAKKRVEEKIKEIFNTLTNIYLDENYQEISKTNLLKNIMMNYYKRVATKKNSSQTLADTESTAPNMADHNMAQSLSHNNNGHNEGGNSQENQKVHVLHGKESVSDTTTTSCNALCSNDNKNLDDENKNYAADNNNNDDSNFNEELKKYGTIYSYISNYYIITSKLVELGESYRSILTSKKNITPYLALGRLIYLVEEDQKWGWCICIEGRVIEGKNRGGKRSTESSSYSNNNNNYNNNSNNSYSNNYSNGDTFHKHSYADGNDPGDMLVVDCLVPYNESKKRKRTQYDDDENGSEDRGTADRDIGNNENENDEREYIPPSDRLKAKWKFMCFHIKCIYQISAVVLSIDKPFDKKSEEEIENVRLKYNTMVSCLKGEKNIPVISPYQMDIKDEAFLKIVKNISYHENVLKKNKLLNNKNLNKYYHMYNKYVALQFEKNILESNIEKCRFIVLKKELKNMLILLESLNYIEISHNLENIKDENEVKTIQNVARTSEQSDISLTNQQNIFNTNEQTVGSTDDRLIYQNHNSDSKNNHGGSKNANVNNNMGEEKNYIVTMKGQIASAILSVDELVISELFFSNFFSKYNFDYICAFLSCFVYDESTNKDITINDPILVEGYQQIIKTATSVANKMNHCGMNINLKDYLDKFKSSIMPIVLLWARGHSFMEILTDSQIYEGSIIRTLRRLDELLRQMICAFRGINNDNMCEILTAATKKLRRGIPFSPSLYL